MSNNSNNIKTIRLLFQEWQGGNNKLYYFGSKLLEWLSPESDSQLFQVPVKDPSAYNDKEPSLENGIVYRSEIIKHIQEVLKILERENPDKVVTFGGDCSVSQVPFDWLNGKYENKVGILWIDAHPDIKTTNDYYHSHAMVLGNLLGEGDKELSSLVKNKFKPNKVMYAGLVEQGLTDQEKEVIDRLQLRIASPESLVSNSNLIFNWIKEENISHIAIHLDLDVLNPDLFRSLLFADPNPVINWREIAPYGKMTLSQISRIINDVSSVSNVVGLSICEHLPYDAWNLKQMLSSFPILNGK
ncbi:hypothetical protein DICPUDRAFT_83851 [Dictyostelium purpureum]|uniref:Arginase n=1 Tax=Dictyostelium purpureum TaxID=5786 RepID=F1A0U0_DICPU|nr:uncharacterized protein DICPUDRAFT_83851 [Dictyostelium purpureum]EGC30191.1 hypothetical protein DICPUDRAFT_83851 [Dictyostelium purpureum]|eukprot:XP_003293280.1 hypothetical protein DICPUDRAFT_83851 [Dictyostelium purpureum]